MDEIGRRIRSARKGAGLSQEELARRAKMSLNGMASIERGEIVDPHVSTLSRIADALGMSVGELLEDPVLLGKGEAPEEAGPTPEAEDEERRALEAVRGLLEAYKDITARVEAVAEGRAFDADAFRKADEGLEEAVSELHGKLRELRDQGVAVGPGTRIGDEVATAETELVRALWASIGAASGNLSEDELAPRRKQVAKVQDKAA